MNILQPMVVYLIVAQLIAIKGAADAKAAVEVQIKATEALAAMENNPNASKQALEDARLNLAIASANVANMGISLAMGASAAASTSVFGGMYASAGLSINSNQTSSNTNGSYSVAGNIFANNINLTAGKDITQVGTNIFASNNINYTAENLNIEASKDTFTTNDSSKYNSVNLSASTSGIIGGGLGMGSSNSSYSSVVYNNVQVTAGNNITLNVSGNATLSGANISGSNLVANIGGNLLIESLQDVVNGSSSSNGFTAGLSVGSSMGVNGGIYNNQGNTNSANVNNATSLVGSNSLVLNVGNTFTLSGAVIFSNTENNLSISAGNMIMNDVHNFSTSTNSGYGINSSIGASVNQQALNIAPNGSTSISLSNTGTSSNNSNLATISTGNITTTNGVVYNNTSINNGGATTTTAINEQLVNLGQNTINNNINNTQTNTTTTITNALDSTLTLNNNLFSSSGREEIINNLGNFTSNAITIGTETYNITPMGVANNIYNEVGEYHMLLPNLGAVASVVADIASLIPGVNISNNLNPILQQSEYILFQLPMTGQLSWDYVDKVTLLPRPIDNLIYEPQFISMHDNSFGLKLTDILLHSFSRIHDKQMEKIQDNFIANLKEKGLSKEEAEARWKSHLVSSILPSFAASIYAGIYTTPMAGVNLMVDKIKPNTTTINTGFIGSITIQSYEPSIKPIKAPEITNIELEKPTLLAPQTIITPIIPNVPKL